MTGRVGAARLLRAGVAGAGLLLAAALGCGVAVPASAAVDGACTDDTGVTVVVDFPGPGDVQTRCAGWPVSSGLDALAEAGFSSTPVQQQPQFVCRIDGVPAEDKCVVTPPADAFWSYWIAQRGGTWAFSATGAATSHPAQGAVEGWAFGAAAPPEVAPPEAPEPPEDPPTSPPPTSPPPTSPPPSASASQPSDPPAEPTNAGEQADPEPGATLAATSAASPTATTPASAATTATATATVAANGTTAAPSRAAAAGDVTSTGGSPRGTLMAIGVLVALGAATGVTAWRRRSAAS